MPVLGGTAGGSGLPVSPDNTYSAPGAIAPTDKYAVLAPSLFYTPSGPMAMTLANGTINASMFLQVDGGGAATVTGNFNGASSSTLSFYSPNGRGSAWLFWNVSASTWRVMNQFDPGYRITDLPAVAALSRTDLNGVNQSGPDLRVDLGTWSDFVLNQGLSLVPLSSNTTLAAAAHNRRDLEASTSLTLDVTTALALGSRFKVRLNTLPGASVTFAGGPVKRLDDSVVTSLPPSNTMELYVSGTTIRTSQSALAGTVSTPFLQVTSLSTTTPSVTDTVTLSFANGTPAGVSVKVDGATVAATGFTPTVTNGQTGASAAGTATFTFTNPSAGSHTLSVSSTGTYAVGAADYPFTTASGPTLSAIAITPTGAGITTAKITGSFVNGKPTAFTATMDTVSFSLGTPVFTTTGGSGATEAGTFTIPITNPATVASHTLALSATGTYSSGPYSFNYTTTTASVTVNTITAPAPNVRYSITGSFANINLAAEGLDYSIDSTTGNDGTWNQPISSPSISAGNSGTFSFASNEGAIDGTGPDPGTYTLYVRGHVNTQVVAAASAFTVANPGGTISAPGSSTMGSSATFPVTVTGSGSPTVYASLTVGGVEQSAADCGRLRQHDCQLDHPSRFAERDDGEPLRGKCWRLGNGDIGQLHAGRGLGGVREHHYGRSEPNAGLRVRPRCHRYRHRRNHMGRPDGQRQPVHHGWLAGGRAGKRAPLDRLHRAGLRQQPRTADDIKRAVGAQRFLHAVARVQDQVRVELLEPADRHHRWTDHVRRAVVHPNGCDELPDCPHQAERQPDVAGPNRRYRS
jgi:hypothetical protein